MSSTGCRCSSTPGPFQQAVPIGQRPAPSCRPPASPRVAPLAWSRPGEGQTGPGSSPCRRAGRPPGSGSGTRGDLRVLPPSCPPFAPAWTPSPRQGPLRPGRDPFTLGGTPSLRQGHPAPCTRNRGETGSGDSDASCRLRGCGCHAHPPSPAPRYEPPRVPSQRPRGRGSKIDPVLQRPFHDTSATVPGRGAASPPPEPRAGLDPVLVPEPKPLPQFF